MTASTDSAPGTVVHVASYRIARGAETYARGLVDELNRRGPFHNVLLTLFAGEPIGPEADVSLEVGRGSMRAIGLDPRVVARLRALNRHMEPSAFVAHGGEPAKYLALSAGDIPYAYLAIGSSHPLLRNPLRRAIRRLYLGRARRLVAVSSQLAADLRDESRGRAVAIVPNGRDPDEFRPTDDRTSDTPVVLFVGNLVEQKQPHLFIDVMRRVSEAGVEFEALMVGDGPLRPELLAPARAAGVSVLGPRDDVSRLMSHADVLVLTSRPPEGLPGVLIEAGMSGMAAVSTEVPGARDVIENGTTGFVVPVDDRDSLVDAVSKVLQSRELRIDMGVEARSRCVERYSMKSSAEAWNGVIADMLGAA